MPDFTLSDGAMLHGGSYRIIRFLSAGGFGCTYEAVHVGLERRVAIKEFFVRDFCNRDQQTSHVSVGTQSKRDLAEKLKRKFLEEARAVAHLNHPGIVRVTDVFEENGTAYFVMDYIDGCGLNQLIADRGRLPEAEALDYIRQAAHALAHVHDTRRLHLDIKPANIMVDKNGHAVLIDFGVSKQYDEAAGENTSTLLGRTPGYAPIEQMSPKLRTFTPATDIYALGATLYKAVTGNTPPDSTELHISTELAFPDYISAPVVRAISSAMKLRAEDRPQSIAEFLAEFLAILDAPAQTPPPASEETCIDTPVYQQQRPDHSDESSHRRGGGATRPDGLFVPVEPEKSGKSKKVILYVCIAVAIAVFVAALLFNHAEEYAPVEDAVVEEYAPAEEYAPVEAAAAEEYAPADSAAAEEYAPVEAAIAEKYEKYAPVEAAIAE